MTVQTDGKSDEKIRVNRGIVVDERMQTSMPGIYCAGDCSEGTSLQTGSTQIIGIWDNAARQGETAGANMAGVPTYYKGNILHNITLFKASRSWKSSRYIAGGRRHLRGSGRNSRTGSG